MENNCLPLHVGIIMDGNGRWATARGKNRSYGHQVGSKNVDKIVSHAYKSGVKALTLYAFSSENWARPTEEVEKLMSLIEQYLKKFIKKVMKNGVCLTIIGDKTKLSDSLVELIEDCEKQSEKNTERYLNIAVNYGARGELVRAVNKLVNEKRQITEESIMQSLDTAKCGQVDLIIRTGGEKRLSNFLLYQSAYSELYFTDVLWPDFDEKEFDKAIEDYQNRNRRFGKV